MRRAMELMINTSAVLMKRLTKFSLMMIILIIQVTLISGAADSAAGQTSFVAGLTGNQEVPVVDTNVTGSALFVSKLAGTISYIVNVTDLANITNAELSIGKQGENGQIAVALFKAASPTTIINGTLVQGNISSANLEGPLKGKLVTDLTNILQEGGAYVNVGTVQNPSGEIRGQIGFEGIDETGTTAGQGNITHEREEVD